MMKSIRFFIFSIMFFSPHIFAEDKLVLDLDLESDLLSLSHNIDNFLFAPTRNYQGDANKDINNMKYSSLKDHLAATALVRLRGEVVGFATEQEIVYKDEGTQLPMASSMWMFRLNYPGLTGFMVVEQRENASAVFSLVHKVINNQEQEWQDGWQMFLSTVGETRIQYASGELSKYRDGQFEEYNGVNTGDFARLGRFRGKIQFVIYPVAQPKE